MRWYPIFVSISGICPDGTCTFCSYINILDVILFSFTRSYHPSTPWFTPVFPALASPLPSIAFAIAASSASSSSTDNILSVPLTCYYSNPLGDHRVPESSDSSSFFIRKTHILVDFFQLLCSDLSLSRSVLVGKICMKRREKRMFSENGCDFERIIVCPGAFCRSEYFKPRWIHIWQENCLPRKLSQSFIFSNDICLNIFDVCIAINWNIFMFHSIKI